MQSKRIRALGIVLITSMVLMMGCGERIGKDGSSGGGTGNGEAISEESAEENQTAEEAVVTTTEAEKENTDSEQQEMASTTKVNSTIYIVVQGRDVFCDEQLLVDHSMDIEDDSIKDIIGDFLKEAKDNQCNVRLNIREADPRMDEIVTNALKEQDIEYEIEGE